MLKPVDKLKVIGSLQKSQKYGKIWQNMAKSADKSKICRHLQTLSTDFSVIKRLINQRFRAQKSINVDFHATGNI